MIAGFKTLLDLPDSDYWYDEGCTEARNIIDHNESTILNVILSELKSWPGLRKEHLAYIPGEGCIDLEIDIINELLLSNDDAKYRAKEALNEFKQRR